MSAALPIVASTDYANHTQHASGLSARSQCIVFACATDLHLQPLSSPRRTLPKAKPVQHLHHQLAFRGRVLHTICDSCRDDLSLFCLISRRERRVGTERVAKCTVLVELGRACRDDME